MLGRDSIFYVRPGDEIDVSDARNRGLPVPPPMVSGPQTLQPSDPEGNWGIRAPDGQIVYRFISHDTTTLDARVSAWSNSTNSDEDGNNINQTPGGKNKIVPIVTEWIEITQDTILEDILLKRLK
jgi:hypothetical protein